MIDALRPALLCTLPCVLALGCFEDPNAVNETDSSDDEVGQTESETDSETSSGTETSTAETDSETSTTETSTAETGELGPQIVESVPTNGDLQAGINGYFFLTFDRPVSSADATGKILASQGDSDPVAVVIMPCPSLDPACLVGLYPESFGDQNSLPGDTDHQIIVSAAFPDPDGLTNETDQIVDFRTFFYEESWYDDNAGLDELWGIAYDPVSESLYLSGDGDENPDGPVIRRVPLPNGSPQPATTAALPTAGFSGPYSYGLDLYGNNLLVSMSYPSAVARYQINVGGNLNLQEIIDSPSLPPPYDSLDEIQSTARAGDGRLFFGFGNFFGGPDRQGIVQRDSGNIWELWQEGVGLWDQNEIGMTVAVGMIGGVEYLFAHNEDMIWQFRLSDGSMIQSHRLGDTVWDSQMQIDNMGRLWFGSNNHGLTAFEVGANDFTEIASRAGLDAGCFAVRNEGTTSHVYFGQFRDDPDIGYTRVEF